MRGLAKILIDRVMNFSIKGGPTEEEKGYKYLLTLPWDIRRQIQDVYKLRYSKNKLTTDLINVILEEILTTRR